MWPFAPNWRDTYDVSYEFRTDIFASDDGSEQRRALRTTPRKSITFTGLAQQDQLRRFNRLMDTAQKLPVIMPEVTRCANTLTDLAANAVIASLDRSAPPWMAAGREVVLSDAAAGYSLATVSAVSGSQVTFTTAPGARASGLRIHPALTGWLDEKIGTKRSTNSVAEVNVSFSVEPCSETYDATTVDSIYEDTEWLQLDHNWANPLPVDHTWPRGLIDFGRGRTVTYQPINFPTSVRTIDLTLRSADAIIAFFVRMRGQRGTFLASSLEQDMVPAIDPAGATLTIAGSDVFNAYAGDPVRSLIEINAAGLGLFARRIVNMSLIGGNTVLTLTEALPPMSAAQILRISWLTYARFATDSLLVSYVSSQAAKVRLNIQTLPLGAREVDLLLRATLDGDLRVTPAGDDRMVIYV